MEGKEETVSKEKRQQVRKRRRAQQWQEELVKTERTNRRGDRNSKRRRA